MTIYRDRTPSNHDRSAQNHVFTSPKRDRTPANHVHPAVFHDHMAIYNDSTPVYRDHTAIVHDHSPLQRVLLSFCTISVVQSVGEGSHLCGHE